MKTAPASHDTRAGDVTPSPGTGFQSIWEYEVKPEFLDDFVAAYHPGGAWAALFGQCEGYIGTELERDVKNPHRFLTIDRWQSQAAFSAMKRHIADAYDKLDRQCEAYTVSEGHIGFFTGK